MKALRAAWELNHGNGLHGANQLLSDNGPGLRVTVRLEAAAPATSINAAA